MRETGKRIAGAAALLLLAALLLRAVARLDLARVWREVASVDARWTAAALLCYALVVLLWALQWHVLAPPSAQRRWRDMLSVVAMSSSVLNTAPMLVGEAASVFFLVTRAGLARAAAVSVLAMDQLLVGLAKLAVLGAAATYTPLPSWMAQGIRALVLAVVLLLTLLGAAAWRRADVMRLSDRMLPRRVAGSAGRAVEALAPLRSPARGSVALALALIKRVLEMTAIIALQHAFGVALPITSALLVLAALHLATFLPLVPGNVGVYETAVVLAYGRYGVPPERALAMAAVQHACSFAALALPGYAWLVFDRRDRSEAAAL